MKLAEKIRRRVGARNELELFSFNNIVKGNESHAAISKELSRLNSSGVIVRLQSGIYYKPKQSRFGVLSPSSGDILKYLLFDKGKQVGYISGERSHSILGLTSQVSNVITIASNQSKRSGKFGGLNIRYVKAYGRIDKDDIYLLQILDAIKDIDKILDANVKDSLEILAGLIEALPNQKKEELVKIAENYPPRVRAVVGAMMSKIWQKKPSKAAILENLKNGIINTNRFYYPKMKVFANQQKWNINEPTLAG